MTTELLSRLADRADVSADRPRTDVIAPFTGDVITSVPEATPGDVVTAAEAARKVQSSWSQMSPAHRARVLLRFHDLLIDEADTALDLIQLEAGKSRIAAFEEVYDTIATARYYANTGPGLLRRRRRAVSIPGATRAYEYRHPHGVVASITPWNFPFTLAISDILPALMAGNAVLLKPDEKTPLSALYGVVLLEQAGIPDGLIRVLTGHGDRLGKRIVDTVDFVAFTGSTAVGRLVATEAGRRLIGSSMELGGKNAAIVLEDADLDKTIPALARAVYANSGQLCISMERIYVDRRVSPAFTERFVEQTRRLELSSAFDFSSDLSSMISKEQLDSVHSHVEEAVAMGATLLTGGKPRPDVGPLFYDPTVLTDVDESMSVCRVETFGPVVSIYPFDEVDEAVDLANDSDFGLHFSVWTADARRGQELATQLRAGSVSVNDGYAAVWSTYDAPMGGMKSSGQGRRHGAEGLLKFTEPQTVAVQRWIPSFAPPGSLGYPRYQRLLNTLLKLLKRLPFYK